MIDDDGPSELEQALLCCFSELWELSIEEGRSKLATDGEMYINRGARAISMIRVFCDAHLADLRYDWLSHMYPDSNNPVVGFSREDLGRYEDANEAARRFVIENVYEVLFPERRGVF
jgi:hypothetical protein